MNQAIRIQQTITGEFLTSHARSMVLKGRWQAALSLLVDDLEGMSYDLAFDILKGNEALIDTDTGLSHGPDQSESGRAYRDELERVFGHLHRFGDRFYRPIHVIRHFHETDAKYAIENGYDRDDKVARAELYTTGAERVSMHMYKGSMHPIIFEPVEGVPMWVTGHSSAQEALDAHTDMGVVLSDPSQDFGLANHETPAPQNVSLSSSLAIEPEQLGEQVRSQAKQQGGFMTMEVKNRAGELLRTLSVPRNAFYRWALQKTPARELGVLPEWEAIAPSGYKMGSDCRVHSDWWFGAGLTMEDYWLDDAPGTEEWKQALSKTVALQEQAVQREVLGFDAVFLGAIKGCQGTVKKLRAGETLNPGEVGVIPHAGPEFEAAMRSATKHGSGLICLTGGRLAHLAVVAREASAILVMWPEAVHLVNGQGVVIDPEARQVRVKS